MADRREVLLRSITVAVSRGLELGPLTNPVVTRDMGEIRYLDHVDTDSLRARYASHDRFDLDAIVPIDYASAGRSVHQTVGVDAPFDYVVASHVIEHVPDVIAWFWDIRSVLTDGGVLTLAIPDHRRCFDALRSATVAADVIGAHLARATVPSPAQVFDHYASAVAWHGLISWGEEPPFGELVAVHSLDEAIATARSVTASGDYHDVHCWVFTPRSFCRLVATLQQLALVPFSIETCTDSIGGEFFVTMRAADPVSATVSAAAPTDVSWSSSRGSESAAVRSELAAVIVGRDRLRDELAATVASRSWRITAPLRRLNGFHSRRSAGSASSLSASSGSTRSQRSRQSSQR
jgi:Methyltransferase domain